MSQIDTLHALGDAIGDKNSQWYAPSAVNYSALSCTILLYLALSYTILHSLTLFCTVLNYLALSCTISHYLAHKVYM